MPLAGLSRVAYKQFLDILYFLEDSRTKSQQPLCCNFVVSTVYAKACQKHYKIMKLHLIDFYIKEGNQKEAQKLFRKYTHQ